MKTLFETRIFSCRKCKGQDPSLELMNPYMDSNEKIMMKEPKAFPEHRKRFMLDYLESLDEVQVMMVGEAPGLDGCGFTGIPFTSEENAVSHLNLPNYHDSRRLQSEESSTKLYDVFQSVARKKGVTAKDLVRKIFMTNCCMCIPLAANRRSIDKPSKQMKNNCSSLLDEQISKCDPEVIITLGNQPYQVVRRLFDIVGNGNHVLKARELKKVTECAEEGIVYRTKNGVKLIPEIHPSPINRPLQPKLWDGWERRMCNHLEQYITL